MKYGRAPATAFDVWFLVFIIGMATEHYILAAWAVIVLVYWAFKASMVKDD